MVKIKLSNGRKDIRIGIYGYFGFLETRGYRHRTTDSNGLACIDFDDYGSVFHGEILVEGKIVYQGDIDSNGYYLVQPEMGYVQNIKGDY